MTPSPAPTPAPSVSPTFEELIPDEGTRELWIQFLDGGWVRGSPPDPGVYMVASAEKIYVGLKEYLLREGKIVERALGYKEPEWQGYVWSHPLPPPPITVREQEGGTP